LPRLAPPRPLSSVSPPYSLVCRPSCHFVFFCWYGDHRDLHSFPTRRSSDLRGSPGSVRVDRLAPHGSASRKRAPLTTASAASAADRKSTRLNSSHVKISYAVFCLKKKKNIHQKKPIHQSSLQLASALRVNTT